ncbi:uncharacterized protein ASPGLDRAFT_1459931 [Aspergillus glaucus CBS 516.65]|uniref:Uncharacterized protein n=1 Tax=Aspergillus glaucus CBS 516.65 TaxID=1160497 RepID=A0A1L9VL77_ASPGL|nr:hypothetical protein ASPGLDRAFT_1459931 [Aspergillus glaucus CBS 516.65]OJJ84644.1 hypothetical protein ASPGLDRAFT_1459931 [Aspergillus glaucus CBS 516.65]
MNPWRIRQAEQINAPAHGTLQHTERSSTRNAPAREHGLLAHQNWLMGLSSVPTSFFVRRRVTGLDLIILFYNHFLCFIFML